MKRVLFIDHVERILGGAEINLVELLDHGPVHRKWQTGCAVPRSSLLREALDAIPSSQHLQFADYRLNSELTEMRVVGRHPLAPLARFHGSLQALKAGRKLLAGILSDFKPDAVVSIPNKDHIISAKICRDAGIPHLWWINDILSKDFFPWLARTGFFRAARQGDNYFAAVSKYASEALIRGGLPRSRVMTVHNGIPLEKYRPVQKGRFRQHHGLGGDSFLFGVIGRWCPWKGQDHFLRTAGLWAERFPDSDVNFLVIGKAFNQDQPFEVSLREQAAAINSGAGRELVRFIDFQKNLNELLADLDCLVHTSVQPEPFGRVLVEAMAGQTPVIGAQAGAVPEIIGHEVNGLLAQPGSTESYLEQMSRIFHDSELRNRLVEAADARVREKFTVGRVFEDLDIILERMIDSR